MKDPGPRVVTYTTPWSPAHSSQTISPSKNVRLSRAGSRDFYSPTFREAVGELQ